MCLRKIYRFANKRSYFVSFNGYIIKFYHPKKYSYKSSEHSGNKAALLNPFFQKNVMPVKPIFGGLKMIKGSLISIDKIDHLELFIDRKLEESKQYPFKPFDEIIDFSFIKQLIEYGLNDSLFHLMVSNLRNVSLPSTGSHGDLHADNIVLISDTYKIIDWSMYSANGSFVLDYIHFNNYQIARQKNISWTMSILEDGCYLNNLSTEFNISVCKLRKTYCMSRIFGELSHRKKASKIKKKQIVKYNTLMEKLLENNG
jgi:hypothetical protein